MAVVWRHDFTGTAGTNGSAATPTVGSAMSFNFGTESTLDGSGNLVAGDAYYDIPTGSMSDATIKVRWTPPAIFTGDLLLFFRADAASGVPFNTDATALFMQGGQTIALQDRGPANSNDGTLATAGTAVAGTPIDIWIRLDGARCRVWLGANADPLAPDMDTSSMSRTTGHAGLRIVGSGAAIDFIEFDNVASSPGASVPPLASPVQTRTRRLRGHPLRTLTLRGNGVAAGGPTYLEITSATLLRALTSGAATVDPRVSGLQQLRTLLSVTTAPDVPTTSATSLRTLSQAIASLDPAIASAMQLRTLLSALPTLTLPIETATLIRSAFVADVALDSAVVLDIVAATLIRTVSETTVTLLPAVASAAQLRTLGSGAVVDGPAVAGGSLLRTLGATAAVPLPPVSLATVLRTLGSAGVAPSPAIALATAGRSLGSIAATLDPAVAGGSALRTLGATMVGLTIPVAGANTLRSEFIALISLDPAVPVLEVTSATLIRALSGALVTLDPAVAGSSTLRSTSALLAALGLAAPHGMTQRVLTGTAVLPTLPITAATLWRWQSSTLVTVLLPGDGVLRWLTFAVQSAPAITRQTGRAPAITTDAAAARAVRWQRAAIPSLDQENP